MLSTPTHHLVPRDIPLRSKENELKLVSDMPDSNRNWKGKYFFVKGTN